MSATASPAPHPPPTAASSPVLNAPAPRAVGPHQPPASPPPLERSGLRRRALTVLVLGVCAATALLAVPDLRPVLREIAAMNPALVAVAIALELASCLSFVVIFRLFFRPVPTAVAREMAWSQMGSGALLPGGGVGSLAAGGWLLHLAGMPTRQIVRRSSGLFFLTSGVNVIVLGVGGLFLLLGIGGGPDGVLLAGVPTIAAITAIAVTLGLPNLTREITRGGRSAAWLEDLGAGIPAARDALLRPNWRLLGAFGYLLFDIAVLWTTLAAAGHVAPVPALVVAYLAGYLVNVVPIPGGIGVLDAGLVGALVLYGMPVSQAAAAVLVYHAVSFWIPTGGGVLEYARLRPRLASLAQSPPQAPGLGSGRQLPPAPSPRLTS